MGFTANGGDTEPMLASGRNLGSGLLVGSDDETITGDGDIRKAQHLHRSRRPGFFDLIALVVDDGSDTAPCCTRNHGIADTQCSVLHEHSGDWTATNVEV